MEDISIFLENQISPKTSSTYRWALERWFAFLGDRPVSEQEAIAYRQHLEETLSPRSAALAFNTVRVYYRWAGGESAFERLKAPKRVANTTPEVPEDSTIEKMVKNCTDVREKAILSLLLNGLRRSEVANLTKDAFWYSEEYDAWLLKVIGKGMKERIVPATSETVESVLEYSQDAPEQRRWLILGRDGGKLSDRHVEYVVEKHSRAAGGEFRPHRLRHHYATRLIRSDVDVTSVQRLLGHENIQSTQIYTHLDLKDVISASKKDPRNKEKRIEADTHA